MAKAAKSVEVQISEKTASKFIESARGTYMNAARREREAMVTIYEGMAARGVSQKSAKVEIKIVRAMEKIKGWIADLEAEDRKMVQKLAKAVNDKKQLMLFPDDLPKAEKPPKAKTEAKQGSLDTTNVVNLVEPGAA